MGWRVSDPPKRSSFLPFAPPLIGEEEIAEVAETLRSGWITTGPETRRFEAAFAQRIGAGGALALNSCTAGLHTGLVCLALGPGDEVITTPLTFCATVNVIEHVDARPVLVDVEPDTLNIDPARIEAAITPRTRAIMPVHYAGHPVDLVAIFELAAAHDLAVVEDAAHALPAKYKGRTIGSGPNPVSFSFYATKNLTTGEGGMLTAAPDFLERARVLALHGMSRDAWQRYEGRGSWPYEVVSPGFRYNMSDLQASLGLAQLARLDSMQWRRRRIVAAYQAGFAGIDALEPAGRTRRRRARLASLCPASPARRPGDRPERLHPGARGAQHRRIGALHSGPPASLLQGQVRVCSRRFPGRPRQLRAHDQPAAQPEEDRSGRRRRHRGRSATSLRTTGHEQGQAGL
jgi:dTDP-4-amino-4,6-dideoxygalactose transaminase